MKSKKCITCHQEKPISEYYPIKHTSDKRFNECKVCVRTRVRKREERLRKENPEWAEKEAARHRIKTRKYAADGRVKPISKEKKREIIYRHNAKHPNKKKARDIVGKALLKGKIQRLPCGVCGSENSEAHHDDYDKPLDVIFLCPKHHAERHVMLRQQQRLLNFKP